MQSGLPERFAIWRAAKGLTLQQVADTIGATRQTISYWECGENDIGVQKLEAICRKAFGIDLVTFFGPLPRKPERTRAA